jgi:hypothetical protein
VSAVLEVPAARDRLATTKLEAIPPAIRKTIIDRVLVGVPPGTAAMSVGVNRRTFQRWLERGRRDDAKDPYRKFANQIDVAIAEWQFSKVQEIDGHAAKDWRAGAWMLERLDPETYGDHLKGGGQSVNVQVVLAVERKQTVEALLAAAGRVLADDPEKLEALIAEIAGPVVVDGEAVEVAEITA